MDNRLSKKYHLHQNTKKYNKLYDTLSLQVPINASALNTWTRPRSAQHCFAFYPPPPLITYIPIIMLYQFICFIYFHLIQCLILKFDVLYLLFVTLMSNSQRQNIEYLFNVKTFLTFLIIYLYYRTLKYQYTKKCGSSWRNINRYLYLLTTKARKKY